jgi:hypothetical protein
MKKVKLTKKEVQARYYARHKDKLRAKRRANQAYNTKYAFLWSLKNEYHITLDDFDRMIVEQSGRCKICGQADPKLHIDHDHQTGKVRGLLCGPCNRALGIAKDNPALLRAMAAYLE